MLLLTSVSALAIGVPASQNSLHDQIIGTFTNEEQVYFESDAGRTPPPWMSFKIAETDAGIILQPIDAFGKVIGTEQKIEIVTDKNHDVINLGTCSRFYEQSELGWKISAKQNKKLCRQPFQINRISEDSITLRLTNGNETILKRARQVECWAAAKKIEPKEDGSPDWLFEQNLTLHDQGGRVMIGGGDSGAEPFILRMRAVYWPKPSTNRPSMVLYVHKPENSDSAVSYSWADIDASRVGLNLRWMQASCSISGAEQDSADT